MKSQVSARPLTLKLTVTALMGAGVLSSASVWAQAAADKTEAVEAPTVVVTGVKASLIKSLAIKRTNDQVVESVVADDIGKLPDNNVVEALQRVTGVQVTNRSGGEVGTLSIRGLPDVQTTWNGRTIFTASGTQVALQDIPSTLVRQIDVYKTRDASQLETGIAGQVDVKSLRPFDFKGQKISLSGRETFLDPARKANPQLSAMYSNRWETGIGEFGALVNLSESRTKYRNESVTPGAMVPFVSPNAAEVPAGYTPLQRITDTSIWTPGTNACRRRRVRRSISTARRIRITCRATPFSRATSRASASVRPRISPCSGNRTGIRSTRSNRCTTAIATSPSTSCCSALSTGGVTLAAIPRDRSRRTRARTSSRAARSAACMASTAATTLRRRPIPTCMP